MIYTQKKLNSTLTQNSLAQISDFGNLKAAWYARLEHTSRVVLFGRCLHFLDRSLAIARKGILRDIRIVEIEVWVVSSDAFGILADSVDEVRACALEEGVLLSSLP